ncbi:MAG TPA: Bax inhibitor-1/YccA family protein [Patescibacteria group bacterium]|nr:Bax inhibitor-1/YccA family protein [Patescibacteria group bacterium]
MTYDPINQPAMTATADRVVDAGLQSHMRSVYNNMIWGLALTGATAFGVANIPALYAMATGPMHIVFAFAPLAFLWFGMSPSRMMRMDSGKAFGMFMLFCVLMGISFSTVFAVYSGASIARTFFITSATFAGMSLWGYTTKRDLSGMGHFMIMGMMGLFIAMIVNMFLESAMVHFVVSAIGVVVFTGITAWETQVIKETYAAGHGRETNSKLAIIGALSLYMGFVNLFQFLLAFTGQRD